MVVVLMRTEMGIEYISTKQPVLEKLPQPQQMRFSTKEIHLLTEKYFVINIFISSVCWILLSKAAAN